MINRKNHANNLQLGGRHTEISRHCRHTSSIALLWIFVALYKLTYPSTKPNSHSEHSTVVLRDIHRSYSDHNGENAKNNMTGRENS